MKKGRNSRAVGSSGNSARMVKNPHQRPISVECFRDMQEKLIVDPSNGRHGTDHSGQRSSCFNRIAFGIPKMRAHLLTSDTYQWVKRTVSSDNLFSFSFMSTNFLLRLGIILQPELRTISS